MGGPVARIHRLLSAERLTRGIGDDRDPGFGKGYASHHLLKRRQDGIHHVGMEGVRRGQASARDAVGVQTLLQRDDLILAAGDDGLIRRIDRCHIQLRSQVRHGLGFDQRHSEHSAGRHGLHQSTPRRDDADGLLQGEDVSQARCDVFAETVADQVIRLHAPVDPEPGQRNFHNKQRRLRRIRSGQCLRRCRRCRLEKTQ